ncbi:ABC transporter ATP-binding protein [Tenacibaculum sp. 190524A02b]|uniref:ABC transporter ATP-binding protein n=1 Tax=Tenacibaculum vairaonense TaxID=3137860 RepID=A0ABP1FBF6_9FLAO
MLKFPHYKQLESKDCGPTCLKIISKHFGKIISIQELRKLSETTRTGSSLLNISDAAEELGYRSLGAKLSLTKILDLPLPCILHWNKNHYVVLYKIKKNTSKPFLQKKKKYFFYISDPAHGLLKYSKDEFLKNWIGNNATEKTEQGIVLFLEPTPKFYNSNFESDNSNFGFKFLSKYLFKYKHFLWQLVIGLTTGSFLQLIFPFLTQSIVDIGIKNQDIHFVYLILFAQLALFLGQIAIEIIRSWILLHLSARINISLVSDFFIKLMNLPISFFDTRLTGDILQRINDHKRIERILTTSSLNVLFSMVNLIIFSFVLAYYNLTLYVVFLLGSFLYLLWILIFLKKRKDLDYKRFSQVSKEQSKVIELINGMQEIKLHNAEKQMRWSWEFLQAQLFKVSIEGLTLSQYQGVGSNFINRLKNILISILSAKLVIEGDITLGMMLSISYIVGQLNSPISQLINFIKEVQDAKISLERLSEIHSKDDEEKKEMERISDISTDTNIELSKVSFKYIGSDKTVLKDLDLNIPANKITAIVGVSGSGKTTLMKLLLKFYELKNGEIKLGNYNLNNISHKAWRNICGIVMQEGYIFSDTIAKNIAVGVDYIDKQKLSHAVDVANIKEFIESLPLSYNTKIGMEGIGLSTGQKQRLLIARAVYKNPSYLFFDEATSALDTNNEKVIMQKLNTFFKNKTVVVIAHRLSTVKNANQIVVLDKGKIVEVGNHEELIQLKGNYYDLVKNQLELGQ